MKRNNYIIVLLLMIVMSLSLITAKAYLSTGHDDIQEISFEDDDVVLLVKRSKEEIKGAYNKVSRKFIGWSTYYFNINSKATYVGDTVFSRSNRTSEIMNVSYKIREEDFSSKSIKKNGSIDLKLVGNSKNKKLQGTINPEIGFYKDNVETKTIEEITDFKINISPYTKISLRITGECYVSSGVSKYYLLGIQLKKGEWEEVDIETMYYEMYEEKIQ